MSVALVTGAGGQLATELVRHAPEGITVVALASTELDVGDAQQVAGVFDRLRPGVVLNAAAYTAVDRAEGEEAEADRVNHLAVRHLVDACRRHVARLVHVSTDYVFDGCSSVPYEIDSRTSPISAYGRTKLAGERAALEFEDALVVRTAWVYAAHGGNFVRTMLRLMQERTEVRVVCDQLGSPTAAPGLARALWGLLAAHVTGLHHWSDSGVASWYDFACAIQEESATIGFRTEGCRVLPIRTSEYPTRARRPAMSVLAKEATWRALGSSAPHWRQSLRRVLQECPGLSAGAGVESPNKGER